MKSRERAKNIQRMRAHFHWRQFSNTNTLSTIGTAYLFGRECTCTRPPRTQAHWNAQRYLLHVFIYMITHINTNVHCKHAKYTTRANVVYIQSNSQYSTSCSTLWIALVVLQCITMRWYYYDGPLSNVRFKRGLTQIPNIKRLQVFKCPVLPYK